MDRTDTSLIALRRILRATELYGRTLAQTAGLTPVQIRLLQIVLGQGSVTPKQISVQMGVSPATISTLLDRMVAKSMIERQRSDVDRRQTNIVLTEEGRKAVEGAPDPLQQKYVKEFEALEDWEQAMIVAALERVAGLLNASDLDASPLLDMGEIHRTHPSDKTGG
ncbi:MULTISPECIES: MarR family transcriptional regulator [Rhodobacterales]|uniref:MarR family winged helix-turn-helix transcriptional regulator n=1 Tax=Roseobacter sp. N2S TaxID=2663844 RepID=UPI00285C4D42|nr:MULTISPECIES: MarR family transcriptional regulator [Rhodobacterales]MDR6263258.1 DNA-binding MarR family transcriptional regulator [Roseobacter sp. N2S]